MANCWPRGKEPKCPVCRINVIRVRTSTMCHPCWTAQRKAEATQKAVERLGVGIAASPVDREPLTSYDEARAQWEREIGLSKDRYKGPAKAQASTGRLRVTVASDIHAPFHDREALADCITQTKRTTDLFVVPGDLADCYSVSRFIKYDPVGFSEEWAEVQAVVELLSENFPRVRIAIGNHDSRLEKQIHERCTSDMVEAIRWMTGGTLCPLSMLVARYPNVEVVPHVTNDGHRMDWFTTVGDALLLHAEKYSRVPGSALRSIHDWIEDFSVSFDLSPYKLILQAHTHQMGVFPWRGDKLLAETGCLASTQGYMTTPRIGGRPQRRGWTTFTQYDGVTDLNSVHQEWWDVRRKAA